MSVTGPLQFLPDWVRHVAPGEPRAPSRSLMACASLRTLHPGRDGMVGRAHLPASASKQTGVLAYFGRRRSQICYTDT
jgi:hypothetical protein